MTMSQAALAQALGVPARYIYEFISGKRAISLDISIRLGRFFGQNPGFWIGLQQKCDLRNSQALIKKIQRQVKPCKSLIAS